MNRPRSGKIVLSPALKLENETDAMKIKIDELRKSLTLSKGTPGSHFTRKSQKSKCLTC